MLGRTRQTTQLRVTQFVAASTQHHRSWAENPSNRPTIAPNTDHVHDDDDDDYPYCRLIKLLWTCFYTRIESPNFVFGAGPLYGMGRVAFKVPQRTFGHLRVSGTSDWILDQKNDKKLILRPAIYQIKKRSFYFTSKCYFMTAICNPFSLASLSFFGGI